MPCAMIPLNIDTFTFRITNTSRPGQLTIHEF